MTAPIERFHPDIHSGLTAKQVEQRMKQQLHNEPMGQITKTYKEIFRDNIATLFNLINAILAALIIYVGSYRNLLFLGVALSNLVIGIVQEIRAKRTLDKLSLIHESTISVVRDHQICQIHTEELVLDDIMILKSGAQICSDCYLREGKLEVNESNVNGESDVIVKRSGDFLYSGSVILSGSAYAQVEHVGEANYANSIMKDAKVLKKHKSELRDSINFIIKSIGIAIIPIGILLFLKQYYWLEYSFADAVVPTVSAIIGMIPEGLVLLTSVALAVGSIHLAKHHTLVQELYCIETLARVDMLCLDKTGTITQGNMQVESIVSDSRHDIKKILAQMMFALDDDNSTAQAIRQFIQEPEDGHARAVIPFSSARKYSAVAFAHDSYVLGAYEYMPIQKDPMAEDQIAQYAAKGYRVLTLAHSHGTIAQDQLSEPGTVIAFILLSDPIRKEAADTLNYFAAQGVAIKIISGDNPITVQRIAQKANVANAEAYIDASTLSDEQIPDAVQRYTVFGRVTPQQKKLIIHELKQHHTTAMIGDGVNDVMALKEADCSIAMAQGSEAAKNIANLVLLDNNFKNMPYIVAEGRRVINNIQRAASLFLVKTIFSTLLAVITLFLNSRYPFVPIQLTLISSLTIGIPSFFLALEPNYNRVKGNFVINVLSHAAPGAFMVVAAILSVSLFTTLFSYGDETRSTMCVILTGACMLTALRRICSPFTRPRRILFSIMTAAFILAITLLPNVFMMIRLDFFSLCATLVGVLIIPMIMTIIHRQLGRFHRIHDYITKATNNASDDQADD